ncbi:MAG: major capsid protein [Methylobacterium mesophilicum]|nr:major capsid protein [Methylobacterium mesophilicum]
MATVLDIISAPEFSDQRLTETINIPPYETGRLAQLGVFADTPIATTYVRLEINGDEIAIIPAIERGGPANKNMRDGTGFTTIPIPHFPLDDSLGPADVQNIMAFGEDRVFQTVGGIYNQKLAAMRSKHDATASHLDWGALRGLVVDARGRVLCDLFSQFGITQDVTDFAMSNTASDMAALNRSVKSKLKKQLRGNPSRGVKVFAGPVWFDTYVKHQSIKDTLKYYKDATTNPAREDVSDTFDFAGLSIERIDEDFQYRQADGTFLVRDAIGDSEAYAIPLGTTLFKRYLAPADTLATANNPPNPGDRVHVSTDDLPHGKGRDIHTESNQLPICVRPGVIQKLTMS